MRPLALCALFCAPLLAHAQIVIQHGIGGGAFPTPIVPAFGSPLPLSPYYSSSSSLVIDNRVTAAANYLTALAALREQEVRLREIVANRRAAKEAAEALRRAEEAKRPIRGLSAPLNDLFLPSPTHIKVNAIIQGMDGRTAAVITVNDQLRTVQVGDSFTVRSDTFRVEAITERGLKITASTTLNLR